MPRRRCSSNSRYPRCIWSRKHPTVVCRRACAADLTAPNCPRLPRAAHTEIPVVKGLRPAGGATGQWPAWALPLEDSSAQWRMCMRSLTGACLQRMAAPHLPTSGAANPELVCMLALKDRRLHSPVFNATPGRSGTRSRLPSSLRLFLCCCHVSPVAHKHLSSSPTITYEICSLRACSCAQWNVCRADAIAGKSQEAVMMTSQADAGKVHYWPCIYTGFAAP
jgi:hypothetical protein